MKGMESIPSLKARVQAYNRIQGAPLTEETLLKYFQWVRFDPRLGEILVHQLHIHWKELNPMILHKGLRKTVWPSVMGVLLEMTLIKIKKQDRHLFEAWMTCVLYKIPRLEFQEFFIGLSAFAGRRVQQQVKNPIKIFKKWNFYGSHLFYNKELTLDCQKTLFPRIQRLQVLSQFLEEHHQPFTVNDYLRLFPIPISRRLAEMDLRNHPQLTRTGHTRNRKYQASP